MDGSAVRKEYGIGMLAKSMAGHDRDRVYVIIDADDTYVYLADGKLRTLDKPKKKKRKHIQLIKAEHDIRGIDDVGVKRILKEYLHRGCEDEGQTGAEAGKVKQED